MLNAILRVVCDLVLLVYDAYFAQGDYWLEHQEQDCRGTQGKAEGKSQIDDAYEMDKMHCLCGSVALHHHGRLQPLQIAAQTSYHPPKTASTLQLEFDGLLTHLDEDKTIRTQLQNNQARLAFVSGIALPIVVICGAVRIGIVVTSIPGISHTLAMEPQRLGEGDGIEL